MEERIILYSLNQILCLIDDLHTSDDIKKSLKVMVLYDFLDNEQYNDEHSPISYFEFIKDIQRHPPQTTIGILNIRQLERFITVFISRMRSLCFANFEDLLLRFNNLKMENNPPLDFSILNISNNHGYNDIIYGADCIFKKNAIDIFLFYTRFDKLDGSNILDTLNLSLPIFNDIFFRDIGKIYPSQINVGLTKYISSWFTFRVSVNNWLQFPKLSIYTLLSKITIHINLRNKILDYMKVLFDEHVDQIFNTLVREFLESNSIVGNVSKAEAYLNIIELLINNKPINSFGSGINSVFNATSSNQLNDIIIGYIPSKECYDIHSKVSYANSFAILKFRTYLVDFLKKNKGSSFDGQSTPVSDFNQTFSHNSINSIINNIFIEFENLEYFEDKKSFEMWHLYNYGNIYNTDDEIEEGKNYDKDEQFFIFDKINNRLYYEVDEFEFEFKQKLDEYIKNVFRPLFIDCKESTKRNISIELGIIKSELLKVQNELTEQLDSLPVNNEIKKIKLPIIQVKLNYIQKLSEYTNLRLDNTSTKDELKQTNTPPLNLDNSVKNSETKITSATTFFEFLNKEHVPDDDASEYINDWINCDVTLDQWLKFRNIDIIDELSQCDLSEEELDVISQHIFYLYCQLVDRVFDNRLKSKFEALQSNDKKLSIAKKDLALIEDLINGNINTAKAERLKSIFHVSDWEKTSLHLDYLMRDKYQSDDNHNIHSKDCYYIADIILKYKILLESFFNNHKKAEENANSIKNSSTKTDTLLSSSTPSFETTFSQKQKDYILDILDSLLIIVDGKYDLTMRKKSSVRGVIESLVENNIIPNKGLNFLCNIIAQKIGLSIQSKLDYSNTSKEYKTKANQFIKANPFL